MNINLPLRLRIIGFGMFLAFGFLAAGLFQTQVLRGGYYRKTGERNRIRLIRLEAPRGNILDRSGVLLATNRPAYHVFLIPEDFNPKDLPELSRLIGLSGEEIRKRIGQVRSGAFTPVLMKPDVSKELALAIEERRPRLGGIFIQVRPIRTYPQGEAAAHVVGYIGKITRDEYEAFDHSAYAFDSWIGRSGIERLKDSELRGEDGGRQLEVNARGVPIQLLNEREPEAGKDVQLTIDSKLESKVRPLLSGKRGVVLMMDLETGALLSAVSEPAFDPSVFVEPSQSSKRLTLIGSKDKPLLNRSFNGLYPPGSVFKLVTAMAALESGVITPYTPFRCSGHYRLGARSRAFKCWFPGGHGRVDLYRGIERSCNVYFYQVGRLVGEKRLSAYARQLGFGSPVPLELATEGGLVPNAEWKNKIHHDPWYPGDTITFAIGQSYLLVSPLQILRLVATIATDGRILEPKLILNKDEFAPSQKKMTFRPETFRVLRQAMLQVVQSDRGTGQFARVDFGRMAAKTGTAQAPPGEAHAWFGGFFPYEDPKIAVVVFIERGKSGGLIAAKTAKQVIQIWNELHGAKIS